MVRREVQAEVDTNTITYYCNYHSQLCYLEVKKQSNKKNKNNCCL